MKIEVGGQIQGISLSSFLQIVQMDKTSCTLKIYSNNEVGYLWLTNGKLVAAAAGDLHGLDAVYDIICWNDTVIVIDSTPPPEKNISTPLISILMEGLRLRDEKAAASPDGENIPSKHTAPRPSVDDQIAMQFVMEESPAISMEAKEASPITEPPYAALTQQPPTSGATDIKEQTSVPSTEDGPWLFEYEDEHIREKRNPTHIILLVFLLFLAIAGTSFGGYLWYRTQTLETEFNTLMEDVASMKNFRQQKTLLETYLDGNVRNRFTPKVTERLNDANALLELDKHIQSMPRDRDYITTSVGLYKAYLKSHRGTPFVLAIRAKMQHLPAQLDSLHYKNIREADAQPIQIRLGIYRAYLEDHPNGKYVREVTNLVASISDEYYLMLKEGAPSCHKEETWPACIAVADTFTAEFPEDSRFNEVWLIRGEMLDQVQLAELKRQAKPLSYEGRRNMYIAYLQKNPNTTTEMEIRQKITLLSQKIEQETLWKNALVIADDPKKTISIRIREVDLYMDRYPNGAFSQESRKKKQSLEAQRDHLDREAKASIKSRLVQQTQQLILAKQRQALLVRQQAENRRRIQQKATARVKEQESRINSLLAGMASRFTRHGNGTFTDAKSGLTWMLLDSKNSGTPCMVFKAGKAWINTLATGGYTDWRLPTPNELALLYNGKPNYPTSGAHWYWTAELQSEAWGTSTKAFTFNPNNKTTFKREIRSLTECGYVHAVRTP